MGKNDLVLFPSFAVTAVDSEDPLRRIDAILSLRVSRTVYLRTKGVGYLGLAGGSARLVCLVALS